jgi:hypothetical protein
MKVAVRTMPRPARPAASLAFESDLYWVHMPDGMTPVDEIVRGLDDLVRSGKRRMAMRLLPLTERLP